MNYEYYSSLALVTSVVVYMLAMFAHAAEWAGRAAAVSRAGECRTVVAAGAGVAPASRCRRPARRPRPTAVRPSTR